MLVLSRKANETITIGEEIRITILSIDADRVKLGIEAPRDMRVYRYETVKKVQVENRTAANANVNLVGLVNIREQIHAREEEARHHAENLIDEVKREEREEEK